MDVYSLATGEPLPEECVDCQACAILHQKRLTTNPPPPHSQISDFPTATPLHPKTKPHAVARLGPLEVNAPPFRETLFE